MSGRIPSPVIVGPERTKLGWFTGDGQIAERVSAGQIRGHDKRMHDHRAPRPNAGADILKERYSVAVAEVQRAMS